MVQAAVCKTVGIPNVSSILTTLMGTTSDVKVAYKAHNLGVVVQVHSGDLDVV
jgi:hypothetical protein